jgi:hypothetical protein
MADETPNFALPLRLRRGARCEGRAALANNLERGAARGVGPLPKLPAPLAPTQAPQSQLRPHSVRKLQSCKVTGFGA